MVEAVIFDLDGVLIDSVPSAQKVRQRLFQEYDIDFATLRDPHHQAHKGSSLKSLLKVAHEAYPEVAIDDAKFAQDLIRGVRDDIIERQLTADPSLKLLLDELKRHKIPLAVTSAGLRNVVKYKLEILGLTDYFDLVITADDVTEHKPNPASYLLTMQKLGVSPGNCIVFEDSASGAEAGHASGAKVIGLTKYSDDKHTIANTVITVDDWSQISYHQLEQVL